MHYYYEEKKVRKLIISIVHSLFMLTVHYIKKYWNDGINSYEEILFENNNKQQQG